MPDVVAHLRSRLHHALGRIDAAGPPGAACSWDAMRAVYEEQAGRGVPGAADGLKLIEQDHWPTSGRRRSR